MRTLLIIVGLFQTANGLAMLALPVEWYRLTPGVTDTGPANIHFIRDIGFAFIAAGVGVLLAALRPAAHAALIPAAIFLGGHAGLHLVEMLHHGATPAAALRDTAMILIPGLLPVLAVFAYRPSERRTS